MQNHLPFDVQQRMILHLQRSIQGKGQHPDFNSSSSSSGNLCRQIFPRTSIATLNFSSQSKKPDANLLGCIETEIKCALESDDHEVVETPGGFPFKIEDNLGEANIIQY